MIIVRIVRDDEREALERAGAKLGGKFITCAKCHRAGGTLEKVKAGVYVHRDCKR